MTSVTLDTSAIPVETIVTAEREDRFDPTINVNYFTLMLKYGIEGNDYVRVRYFFDCGGDLNEAMQLSKSITEDMLVFISSLKNGVSLEEE
jgi:hypothetical protein